MLSYTDIIDAHQRISGRVYLAPVFHLKHSAVYVAHKSGRNLTIYRRLVHSKNAVPVIK